jgi:hypothetical protein
VVSGCWRLAVGAGFRVQRFKNVLKRWFQVSGVRKQRQLNSELGMWNESIVDCRFWISDFPNTKY